MELHLRIRTPSEQKEKWKRMVRAFKEEFTRRHTTGAAGNIPDMVYEKLEELLLQYPTILPPIAYSSYRRSFESNSSAPVATSSVPVAENERPEASRDTEPPSTRRGTVTSPPVSILSTNAPP
ncbi:hypothetical protein HPULCUR_004174 [Helicostylum pulchrum]|uniref:Uncharacterized protein n=1 Tax=Helicostylum pulchrum TaxID=562976 RepID=A0ABP9XWI8_9FUNG